MGGGVLLLSVKAYGFCSFFISQTGILLEFFFLVLASLHWVVGRHVEVLVDDVL